MPPIQIDHPIIAALAFFTALPFAWGAIRAFVRSAVSDLEDDGSQTPMLSYFGWFPEWPVIKLFWLFLVIAALTVTFYKLYTFIGALFASVA